MQSKLGKRILVIKFGANWCKPCRDIKPFWDEWVKTINDQIVCADINIEDSVELFVNLKSKKMVKGVPVILVYYGDIKREQWYIPDDSIIGGNVSDLKTFFERCVKKTCV
jgi:thiol-disulfide isomerase/thioredoxin